MKQTIRLTESELKRLITEAINEVAYNGRSFHGTNASDWDELARRRALNTMFLDDFESQKGLKDRQLKNMKKNRANAASIHTKDITKKLLNDKEFMKQANESKRRTRF